MTYKDALKLAQDATAAAYHSMQIAAGVLDSFTDEKGRAAWSYLSSIENMLFNVKYYVLKELISHED